MLQVWMYACMYAQGCVRLGLVLGRHPIINLFGLHYCDICWEVETKYVTLTRNVPINDTHEKMTPFWLARSSPCSLSVTLEQKFTPVQSVTPLYITHRNSELRLAYELWRTSGMTVTINSFQWPTASMRRACKTSWSMYSSQSKMLNTTTMINSRRNSEDFGHSARGNFELTEKRS